LKTTKLYDCKNWQQDTVLLLLTIVELQAQSVLMHKSCTASIFLSIAITNKLRGYTMKVYD